MNDCVNAEVRDALPDYLNHRLSDLDTATMREHIESCADCRAELALLSEARASAVLAPKMNVDRIASALPAYGSVPAHPAGTGSRRSWMLVAAAAIVAIGGWAISTRQNTENAAPSVASVTTERGAPVQESKAAQSETPVVATNASPKPATGSNEVQVASLSLVGGTDDLSDDDLETLVAALDGIDAVPSVEPASVTTTVEDIDGNDQ